MFEQDYKRFAQTISPSKDLILRTVAKMQNASTQKNKPAGHLKGTIVLAALILLSLIGATAVSLAPAKYINWSGDGYTIGQNAMLYQKIEPVDPDIKAMKASENEIWRVDYPDNDTIAMSCLDPSKYFSSIEEMTKYIKQADTSMLVPESFPKGYRFVTGNVAFFASDDTFRIGIEQLPKETLQSGAIINKWKVSDTCKNDIWFYRIGLEDDNGNILDIFFRREAAEDPDNISFSVMDGGHAAEMQVTGMEKAIYVHKPTSYYSHSITMLHGLIQHKVSYDWPVYEVYEPGSIIPFDSDLKREYVYGNYSICSTALEQDQLIKIAQSFK